MAIRRCTIAGCTSEVSPRSRLEECPACRAYLVAYLKSSPARTLERRQKINLFDSRLQVIMPGDVDDLSEASRLKAPANYKPHSKRGRAVAKASLPKRRAYPSNSRALAHA